MKKIIVILLLLILPNLTYAAFGNINGSGNYLDIAPKSSIANITGGTGTIMFWVYSTTTANTLANISGKTVTGGGWEIFKRAADGTQLRLSANRATTAYSLDTLTGTLTANTWEFYAFTFDLAVSANNKIYKGTLTSGLADVTGTVTLGSGSQSTDANRNMKLLSNAAGDRGWHGSLATFQIFNRILTKGEIQAQQFRPHVTSGNVLFMHLGFNGTATQRDWSGKGNYGTTTGLTIKPHVPLGNLFGR